MISPGPTAAHVNIEIKARCTDPERIRNILTEQGADFKGIDNQTDTYFKVPTGRLKLRQGNIENALIYYHRPNETGPKKADVWLSKTQPDAGLRELLANALGILVTVKKKREIYFIENVKFHIDSVAELGTFVEIEAIDTTGQIPKEKLLAQCKTYMELFAITDQDLIDRSYSDMLR